MEKQYQYKGLTITKTRFGRYVVKGVLGSYIQSGYDASFKTLTAAKAYIDRMAAS
jgi:hypothetical protein